MNHSKTLLQIIVQASQQIQKIGEEEMSTKSSPEKWSKKEILGHLIDSATNNYRRIMLSLSKNDLIFDGYDQVNWVKMNAYQSRDTIGILHLWSALNTHIAILTSQISSEKLMQKTTNHNFDKISMKTLKKGEESNLGYLIGDYIFHTEHHLSQIIEGYQKLNPPLGISEK